MTAADVQARWRLVLGREAEDQGLELQADGEQQELDGLLHYLFRGRGGAGAGAALPGSAGSLAPGVSMTVPRWLDRVQELFPRRASEIMERELIRRRGIEELLQRPEVLERVEPDVELVKAILTHKDLLRPETRELARKIVAKVVAELRDMIKLQVEPTLTGALRRDRHAAQKIFRNLDLRTTIRRNLHNWDAERRHLVIDRSYFFAAERQSRPWHVIIAVDQSGSMLDAAVFSAVMASIFAELPAMRTSLFLFSTVIADLSDQVGQPVDVLMSVQIGGGTNIAMAMRYAAQLVREPARTIIVLVSDFAEGGPVQDLYSIVTDLSTAGVRQIGLGALGIEAIPHYSKQTARGLQRSGMDILSCTPEELAQCLARIIT